MNEREKALRRVQIAQFALREATLYLDNHPTNKQALAYFSRYQQQLQQAVQEFEQQYGPLTTAHAQVGERWNWIDGPWPWEGECEHVGV